MIINQYINSDYAKITYHEQNALHTFARMIALLSLSTIHLMFSNSFEMTLASEAHDLPELPLGCFNIELSNHLFQNQLDQGNDGGFVDGHAFNNIINQRATLAKVLLYDKKLYAVADISCAFSHLQEVSFSANKAEYLPESGFVHLISGKPKICTKIDYQLR